MKKDKRKALAAAAKIVDALRSGGAIAPGAKVEVRVCGRRRKDKGRESKPRARGK